MADKEIKREDIYGFEQALPEYTIVKRALLHSFYECDGYLQAHQATGDVNHLVAFVAATLSLYRKIRPKLIYLSKMNKGSTRNKEKEMERWKPLVKLDGYLLTPATALLKDRGSDEKNDVAQLMIKSYLLMADALEELGVSKITTEAVNPSYALLDGAN